MKQKYHVKLKEEERDILKRHKQSKKHSMSSKKRAGVLLDLDESGGRILASVDRIAADNGVCAESVRQYRKRSATEGLLKTLGRIFQGLATEAAYHRESPYNYH